MKQENISEITVVSEVNVLLSSALTEIKSTKEVKEVDDLKTKYLGKKGLVTSILKNVSNFDVETKKEIGKSVNQAKEQIERILDEKLSELKTNLENENLKKEWIDVTLPLNVPFPSLEVGSLHPLTQVRNELEEIFIGLGFDIVDAPEIDSEFYNFEALNIPDTHPARDMQDTIWTKYPGFLMRTHTSTTQVRTLLERGAPVRVVAPGRCFRYERLDATHEHTFYQIEGMMVDKNVSVGHLIYFMKTLLRKIYGFEPKIRLRPGYFPFVEPGFELDIWFNDRWLELLPCGLMHPEVLKHGGIDPSKWQGFAFGLGLSRLVMTRYLIDDIRHFQSADLRFLRQF